MGFFWGGRVLELVMGSNAGFTLKVQREEREEKGRPGLCALWPGEPGTRQPLEGASGSPGGQLETEVALRGEPVSPTRPSAQALTCEDEDLHHVQGLEEPGRKAELSARPGARALAAGRAFLPSPGPRPPPGRSPSTPWRIRLSAVAGLSLGSLRTGRMTLRLCHFQSQTWSLEHRGAPGPAPLLSFLPWVHLAPPARRGDQALAAESETRIWPFGAGLAPPPAAPQSPPGSELTHPCSTRQDQALCPDPESQGRWNRQGKGHGEPCFPFLLGPSGVPLPGHPHVVTGATYTLPLSLVPQTQHHFQSEKKRWATVSVSHGRRSPVFLCPGACRSHAGVGWGCGKEPHPQGSAGHGWLLTNGGQTQDAAG